MLEENQDYNEELEATGGDNPQEYNAKVSSQLYLQKKVDTSRAFKVHQTFLDKTGKHEIIRATKSNWIHNLIRLDGEKFSFTGRTYLRQIYDAPHPHKLLKTGRQVEKSTMLANEFIVNSCIIPYFKTLYVAPSHDQTRQFSNGKLKPWIDDSPVIQKYFQNSQTSRMVFERSFTNGSIGFLRSAFLTADRTRGVSADCLNLDEIQDILVSNIPVMLETLSHSKYAWKLFSGTPKTLDNPIELYWQESSQCEWLVPCDRHAPIHYNYLDERSIGKTCLICNKCGKPIDAQKGKWIAFSNNRDIMGYRIAQLMTPWFNGNATKWKEIIWKLEHYAKGLFNNEVLGLSYDSASKPVTRTELITCCSSKHPFRTAPDAYTDSLIVFAGVDWGEGVDGSERGMKGKLKNASYTVLSLGAYISPTHFHVFFMKRYMGEEAMPGNCVKDIIRICKMFKVACIGVDWGHGWGVNDSLESAFDTKSHKRVVKFQYLGMQKERKKYDPIGVKYQLNRTEVMTDFFEDLKKQRYVFPEWERVRGFLADVEHIHAEYATSGTLKYDHRPSEPDDAAHSLILCREAANNYHGKQ
jgi:hypothetical protein